MGASQRELLLILGEIRDRLLANDADFAYSQWDTAEQAVATIDAITADLLNGSLAVAKSSSILFAPTGSLQEVSLCSHWGREFLDLAARWDRAIAGSDVALAIIDARRIL